MMMLNSISPVSSFPILIARGSRFPSEQLRRCGLCSRNASCGIARRCPR